jgi:hypothetical protein
MVGGPDNIILARFLQVFVVAFPIGALVIAHELKEANKRAEQARIEAANQEVKQIVEKAQRWVQVGKLADADEIEKQLNAAQANTVATEKDSVAPALLAFEIARASLKVQGLADLAEWTLREGHPAITGLVVDRTPGSDRYLMPGKGYFELFSKRPDDFVWWLAEVERSFVYDWQPYLASSPPPLPPPKTQEASDLVEPPGERVATTIYRVLRDTKLARRVKMMHAYECQICGHTIQLPDGSRYAEAHHIQPLGCLHNGPDVTGNILCLCPNHHAELDYGVAAISLSALRHFDGHVIDPKFVEYHNRNIHKLGGHRKAGG